MSEGPRAGKVLVDLPVADLLREDGGAWDGRPNLKKSKIEQKDGKDVVKVQFDKDSGAPGGNPNGGMSISFSPKGMPKRAVVFAMRVFYPPGFDFARGGKMIGISIGHGKAGGGQHCPTASSHRIMWQVNGGAISYIYPPEGVKQVNPELSTSSFGNGFWHRDFEGVFKPNKWHDVEVGVKMNTFDSRGKPNPDGIGYIRVDGISRELTGMRWAGTEKYAFISNLDVGTFFGGPLTCPKNQHAYYADFRMHGWNDTRKSQKVLDRP